MRLPPEFLQPDELHAITGSRQRATWRRWLDRIGVRYVPTPDGTPLVYRDRLTPEPAEQPAGAAVLSTVAPTTSSYAEAKALFDAWRARAEVHLAFRFISRHDDLPCATGVYLMLLGGEVRYVGQTVHLAQRCTYHDHQWWSHLAFIECPPEMEMFHSRFWLDSVEHAAIRYYRPSRNKAPVPIGHAHVELPKVFGQLPASWCNPPRRP